MYFLTVDAYAFSGGNLSWGSIELALVFNVKMLTLKVLYCETTDLESAIMKLSDNHFSCIIRTYNSYIFENVTQGLIGQSQKIVSAYLGYCHKFDIIKFTSLIIV